LLQLYTLRGHHGYCVGARECEWDGFPSSQFGQLNSPKRNTLETAFSFFKLPLKFSDKRRKSKDTFQGKTGANRRRSPLGRSGRADRPTLLHGPVRSHFPRTPFISHCQPMTKSWLGKTSRETPEK
jgi:hypothetical protein